MTLGGLRSLAFSQPSLPHRVLVVRVYRGEGCCKSLCVPTRRKARYKYLNQQLSPRNSLNNLEQAALSQSQTHICNVKGNYNGLPYRAVVRLATNKQLQSFEHGHFCINAACCSPFHFPLPVHISGWKMKIRWDCSLLLCESFFFVTFTGTQWCVGMSTAPQSDLTRQLGEAEAGWYPIIPSWMSSMANTSVPRVVVLLCIVSRPYSLNMITKLYSVHTMLFFMHRTGHWNSRGFPPLLFQTRTMFSSLYIESNMAFPGLWSFKAGSLHVEKQHVRYIAWLSCIQGVLFYFRQWIQTCNTYAYTSAVQDRCGPPWSQGPWVAFG